MFSESNYITHFLYISGILPQMLKKTRKKIFISSKALKTIKHTNSIDKQTKKFHKKQMTALYHSPLRSHGVTDRRQTGVIQ